MLQAACRIGHFGAWTYEVASGRVVWSDEVRAIHQVPPDYQPELSTGLAFYHPDSREQIAALFTACLEQGTPFDTELILITAQGEERRVRSMGRAVRDTDGKIAWVEGGFQDITEQYLRQRRLAESEAMLAAVFNQSYLYQGVLDHEGRLLEANCAAYNACGYSPENEVGRYFWECSWWGGDEALSAHVREIVMQALGGTAGMCDLDYFIASGERRQTLFSAAPIRVDGSSLRILVSGMDITSRKRNEAFHSALRVLLERIAGLRPLQETLLDILQLIESQFPDKQCSISLLSSDGRCITNGYSRLLPPEYLQMLEGLVIGPSAGSCGTAAYRRCAVVVSDILTDPLWDDFRALAAPYGFRSCWSLPIFDPRGKVTGTFAIYSKVPATPAPGELELVADCAHIAGIAIARAQADLQLQEQASLLDKAHDAIIVRALDHRILFWNRGAERLYGWTSEEAVGQHIDQLLYRDMNVFEDSTLRVKLNGEWQGELQQCAKDGRMLWVEAHWSLVKDDEGQPRSILAINTDISERKASEREIHTLAFYDSLTKLPNRLLLHNRLEQALAGNARSHDNSAILFLDLDNFKALNDTRGHDVGDQLLVQVATRLKHCVRESDTVARIGGDEFVVMLPDLGASRAEAATQARAVADKILAALAQPFVLQDSEYNSTSSIGVALFSAKQLSVDELLKRADLAMYQAKAAGRNTVCFFDPEMQAAVTLRVEMEADLRHGLQNQEFVLYYQAQVNGEGQLIGAESLIRWQHPKRGLMSPFSFISIAEDSGLILPLGVWIIEAACRQLARWATDPARSTLTLAVNVSARQFRHPDFVDQVRDALSKSGANPRRLKLELTESQLVDNVEETIAKMHALRELGVNFSLDDFGTGYSSLTYLRRLPLAQLKIDPSFVREILNNASDAAIARTVIALGQTLQLNVIAEGVETEAQRELLRSLGCVCYQGYLFSRPIPIEDFEQMPFATVRAAPDSSGLSASADA